MLTLKVTPISTGTAHPSSPRGSAAGSEIATFRGELFGRQVG
jgi:hypothetical protein